MFTSRGKGNVVRWVRTAAPVSVGAVRGASPSHGFLFAVVAVVVVVVVVVVVSSGARARDEREHEGKEKNADGGETRED